MSGKCAREVCDLATTNSKRQLHEIVAELLLTGSWSGVVVDQREALDVVSADDAPGTAILRELMGPAGLRPPGEH